ncbi:hypothetical protein CNR22_18395 [Sphingobacteriaceae bacterium]|nr:hypothetical protein CNR22_18395 [Sphingobacteriaceae bacterium]
MKDLHEDLMLIAKGYELNDQPKKSVLFVIHRHSNFVIYEVKETGQISYKTSSDFEDNTFEIAIQLDKVEAFLGEDPTLWGQYKNTMADVYTLYLSNKPERKKAAKKLLEEVTREIQYNKYNKVYYLLPCLAAVILLCLFSLSLKIYNDLLPNSYHPIKNHVIDLINMMVFGSIGGLLSIAIYIDKHDQKFSRFTVIRTYAGLFRILISMLSGLIIYIIYRAGLLYAISNSSNNFFIYALAVIGGFSQNLVPNLAHKSESIISGTDSNAESGQKDSNA